VTGPALGGYHQFRTGPPIQLAEDEDGARAADEWRRTRER
jgi:hypothetical protein